MELRSILGSPEYHIGSRALSKVLLAGSYERGVKRIRKDVMLRGLDPVCVIELARAFLESSAILTGPGEARCLLCGARVVSRNVKRALFHHLTQAHVERVEELGRRILALCTPR